MRMLYLMRRPWKIMPVAAHRVDPRAESGRHRMSSDQDDDMSRNVPLAIDLETIRLSRHDPDIPEMTQ